MKEKRWLGRKNGNNSEAVIAAVTAAVKRSTVDTMSVLMLCNLEGTNFRSVLPNYFMSYGMTNTLQMLPMSQKMIYH